MLKEVVNGLKQTVYRHRDVLHCSFDAQVDEMADTTSAEDLFCVRWDRTEFFTSSMMLQLSLAKPIRLFQGMLCSLKT